MIRRVWPLLLLCAALAAPAARADDSQPIPAPVHGAKKKKKGYDYDGSQYKAYQVLTDEHHYRFDKDGNPIDNMPPAAKAAKRKRRKKKAASPASADTASSGGIVHAHFASQVGTPDQPAASGAPRSENAQAGAAAVAGGSCGGDSCSQPPAGQ